MYHPAPTPEGGQAQDLPASTLKLSKLLPSHPSVPPLACIHVPLLVSVTCHPTSGAQCDGTVSSQVPTIALLLCMETELPINDFYICMLYSTPQCPPKRPLLATETRHKGRGHQSFLPLSPRVAGMRLSTMSQSLRLESCILSESRNRNSMCQSRHNHIP